MDALRDVLHELQGALDCKHAAITALQCELDETRKNVEKELGEGQDGVGSDDDTTSVSQFRASAGLNYFFHSKRKQKQARGERVRRRDALTREGVPKKVQQLQEAKDEWLEMEKGVKEAEVQYEAAQAALDKMDGIHMQKWNRILQEANLIKTAYFGHAYIGRYCKVLTSLDMAVKLSSAFLAQFDAQQDEIRRLKNKIKRQRRLLDSLETMDASYPTLQAQYRKTKEMYRMCRDTLHSDPLFKERDHQRDIWRHRLHKWDQLQRFMGGSIDFSTERGEWLKVCLALRIASYTGFFACHFDDRPTPKQYFAATFGLRFVQQHGFCGFGDEEPCESQHADWNRLWCRYKHCIDVRMSLKACLTQLHARNNMNVTLLAPKEEEEEE